MNVSYKDEVEVGNETLVKRKIKRKCHELI